MIWHVYRENINTRRIEIYNIFDHASFKKDVEEAYATCKTKDEFVEQLRKSLMYYFWSKCEWEVVITDWPTHIDSDYHLHTAEKIDVYDQVKLNWSVFVDYVWDTLTIKALIEDILKDDEECE